MKIAIFTGPRVIAAHDEQLVRSVVREVIARGFKIYVGDAAGVDYVVYDEACRARLIETFPKVVIDYSKPEPVKFYPLDELGRSPSGLAERSTRMVKEALRNAVAVEAHGFALSDSIICIGFPNKPCPAGITPARSWRSGTDESSGTWSTLALCVGNQIETWIFTLSPFRKRGNILPSWGFIGSGDVMPLGDRYEWKPQTNLFNSRAALSHDELAQGWTELARANSEDGN